MRVTTIALVGIAVAVSPALAAERRCHVEGAGGGAVTVSGTPGGAAFTQVPAGQDVTGGEVARDAAGRSWVFVHEAATGRRLGWLPAGAVRCP